jgi:hypothetical protein
VKRRALLVGWHGGGNTPPLLAAGSLVRSANFEVVVLASEEVRREATRAGFGGVPFRSAPPPETHLPFETVATKMMATAAGADVAADMVATLAQVRPGLAVVDCMLRAAIAACERAQHFNARRVVELGAGIRLSPDPDRGSIRAAVKAVLTDAPLAKAAQRLAARIRAEDPDGTALTAMLSVAVARP